MLFDAHAHIGGQTENALIATASTSEFQALREYRYRALGSISGGDEHDEEKLRVAAESGCHIGEIGLDRRYGDMERQKDIFRNALLIAKEYDRLAVIHTVREYGSTLDIIRKAGVRKFMMHGFSGSYETALEVLRMGGMISLSPSAVRLKSFPRLLTLPFLNETDLPAGDEQRQVLSEWTGKLSTLTGSDLSERNTDMLMEIL